MEIKRMTKEEKLINNQIIRDAVQELKTKGVKIKDIAAAVGYSYGGFRNFVCGRVELSIQVLYLLKQHFEDTYNMKIEFETGGQDANGTQLH